MSFNDATPITLSASGLGSIDGEFESYNDYDVYSVNVEQGQSYKITVDLPGEWSEQNDIWADTFLINSDGLELRDIYYMYDIDGYEGQLLFTAEETETLYIDTEGSPSTYTLAVSEIDSSQMPSELNDAVPANTTTTETVEVDGSYMGNIDASFDKDWVKVNLTQGVVYEIELLGEESSAGTLEDPYIHGIYDENSNYIQGTQNDDSYEDYGLESQSFIKPTYTGVHYISVKAFAEDTGSYTLNVNTTDFDDIPEYFNDDYHYEDGHGDYDNDGGSIGIGFDPGDSNYDHLTNVPALMVGDNSGTISSNYDDNYFTFDVTDTSVVYQITLDITSDTWGYLNITNEQGWYTNESTWIDDNNMDTEESYIFTPNEVGTYYINVNGDSNSSYSLNVSTVDTSSDMEASNTTTTAVATLASSYSGSLDYSGDQDWIKVNLTAGQFYELSVDVTSTNDMYHNTVIAEVFDAQGYYESWSGNSEFVFSPETSGDYFFSIRSWDSELSSYEFSVNSVANPLDGATDLIIGTDISSSLASYDDIQYFELTLTANTQYSFSMENSYAWMQIVDASLYEVWDGVSYSWNGNGETLTFTPSSDETYYLKVMGDSGDFTITSSNQGSADKYADELDQATEITLDDDGNGSIDDGKIHSYSDVDYFKANLIAGETYILTASTDQVWQWMGIDVQDANETYIWDGLYHDWQSDYNAQVSFTPSETDTYYFRLQGQSDITNYSFSIGETVSPLDNAEELDISQSQGVSSNFTVTSEENDDSFNISDFNDIDYYKVSLSKGLEYNFTATTNSSDTYAWMDIQIIDANGYDIWDGIYHNWNTNSVDADLSFTPLDDGDYYLKITGSQGTYSVTTLQNGLADAHSNDYTNATSDLTFDNGPIEIEAKIHNYDDSDYFELTLEAGHGYTFTGNITDDAIDWPWMSVDIKDAFDNDIWDGIYWNWDTNDTVNKTFTPTQSGTYYVKVTGSNSDYTLNITDSGVLDSHANSSEGATNITNEFNPDDIYSVNAKIHDWSDVDYFKINISEDDLGHSYVLATEISNHSTDGWDWMSINIEDENENYLWEDVHYSWDSMYDEELIFTPSQIGTYYISIDGSSNSEYTFSVEKLPDPLETATPIDVSTFDSSVVTNVTLENNYEDSYYNIGTLSAGNEYAFTLNNISSNDTYTWLNLSIVDSLGNDVWEGVDSDWTYNNDYTQVQEIEVSFTPLDDAQYYVMINGSASTFDLTSVNNGVVDRYANSIEDSDNIGALEFDSYNHAEITDARIHNWNDYDYFSLEASQGDIFTISANIDSSDWTWMDIDIQDELGNSLWQNIQYNWDSRADEEIVFTASEDDTYYIRIDGSYDYEYTLSVDKLADDGLESLDTTMQITFDNGFGSIEGNIETAYDEDWIQVELNGSKEYIIDLKAFDSSKGTLSDTYLRGIYDSNGVLIHNTTNDDGGSGLESQLEFAPTLSGTYYISAGAYGSNTGTYTLSVTEVADPLESAETLTVTTTSQEFSISTNSDSFEIDSYSDEDYFNVGQLTAGNQYTFTANSTLSSWTWMDINILDENGESVFDGTEINWSSSDDVEINFTPTSTEQYYLEITGSNGTYTVSTIDNGIVDKYADTTTLAHGIDLSSTVTQTIDDAQIHAWDDLDYFTATLNAGNSYTFSANIDSSDWTWIDIDIKDANDNSVWNNITYDWDSLNDEELTFTPTLSGTYYFVIDGSSGYEYTFSATNNGVVDKYGDTIASASTLSLIDGSVSVSDDKLHSWDDEDYFAITLSANESYSFIANSNDSSWLNIDIQDANGNSLWENIAYHWDTNDSHITFNPDTNGTYYVRINGAPNDGYTLNIDTLEINQDQASVDTNTQASMNIGTPYNGEIETANDEDWIEINLTASNYYVIDLKGAPSNEGTLSDTYIKGIYDSDGNLIAGTFDDDGGFGLESQLDFFASLGGTYYINAAAYGSNTGTYQLSVTQQTNPLESAENFTVTTTSQDFSTSTNSDSFNISSYSDEDYFKISMTAGNEYSFKVNSDNTDWPWMNMTLLDRNGNEIYSGVDINWYSDAHYELSYVAQQSTDYYLKVEGSEGIYTITAQNMGEVDSDDDTIANATSLTLTDNSVEVSDQQIHSWDDVDYYSLAMDANYEYILQLDSPDAWWMDLTVLDANGNELSWQNGVEEQWSSSYDSEIRFTPSVAGTYYFKVEGNEGDYSFDISKSEALADDHSDTISNATQLSLATSTDGSVNESWDNDYFQITLTQGLYEIIVDATLDENNSSSLLSNDWGYTYANFAVDVYDNTNAWLGWDQGVREDWNYENGVKKIFEVAQDGTYYINVAGFYEEGEYSLNVQQSTATDDYFASTSTTGNLTFTNDSASQNGSIDYASDEDWFAMTLEANSTYEFVVSSNDMSWSYLDIKDGSGNYVWNNVYYDWDWESNDSIITFTTLSDTAYFLNVGGDEGNYTISADKLDIQADTNISIETATVITLDSNGDGTSAIEDLNSRIDNDYYKVSLNAGESYHISLLTNGVNAIEYGGYFELLDAQGNYIYDGIEYSWEDESVVFTPTANSFYYLQVASWGTNGEYQVQIEQEAVDSIGNSITNHGTFSTFVTNSAQTINEELETSFDSDWFKFTTTEDMIYEISVDSAEMSWPYLTIYDKDGNYIWENIVWDWNALEDDKLYFTALSSDDYFVEVNAWEEGEYDLSITQTENSDVEGSSTTSHIIFEQSDSDNDGEVSGNLDSSYDIDWFKISAVANTTYDIVLNSNTMDDIYVDIIDSNGNYIWDGLVWDWNASEDEKLQFTASNSNDYFIQVSSWQEEGDYTLSFNEYVDPDTVGNSTTDFGLLSSLATDTNGVLTYSTFLDSYSDSDWYEVSLNAGNTYEITLDSTKMDWPYLNILDSNGNYFYDGINWDWSASEADKLLFTPEQSANYFIEVTGWETGLYTLSFEDITVTDDYGNTLQSHGVFNEVDGSDSSANDGIIEGDLETSFDEDWFKFSVLEGEVYAITLNSEDMNDPSLEILNSDGSLVTTIDYDWNTTADEKQYFLATSTGDYFIAVSGREESDTESGEYNVELQRVEHEDDYGSSLDEDAIPAVGVFATIDANDSVANNNIIEGSLGTSFDNDWIQISADSDNTTFSIELNSEDMNNCYINMLDGEGNYIYEGIVYDYSTDVDSKILFTAQTAGEYYIEIDSWESGDYTLNVVQTSVADDYDADTTTQGNLTVGSFVDGNIEVYDDMDWFKIALESDTTYQIDLEAIEGYVPDTIIYGLYDLDGNYIANTYDDDGGEGYNSQLIFNSNSSDDYYIAVSAFSGTGDYRLSVSELNYSDAVSDGVDTTASMVAGIAYSGDVNFAYDEDWIGINLIAGNTYEIDLDGIGLDDAYINGIYDSNGVFIANTSNDNESLYTLDAFVEFTANASGQYYISVGADSNDTGTYELDVSVQTSNQTVEVEDLSTADANNTTDTAIGADLTEYVDGIIDYAGDTDWYEYTFTQGQEYSINLLGSPTDSGTLSDTYLRGVYDSNGDLIAGTSDDDGGVDYNSSLNFTAQNDGTYYVSAGAYGNAQGSYQVNVQEVAPVISEEVGIVDAYSGSNDSWTIMVYLAADNDLEAMALDDINEMEMANLPDNVNVTFLIDRNDSYSTIEGDWTDTRRGVIEHDEDAWNISSSMESIGEQNTGDGQVLTDFINWSVETASADNYGLVIWNHGGGISGVAWDYDNGYDQLTINEVSQAIEGSVLADDSTNGNELDMLGFDTCLSGVVDMTYAMKDVADIVVASEELEPGDGWDYTGWFNSLNSSSTDGSLTSTEVATDAVESYEEFYANYVHMDTTLSAVDTDLIDEVVDAFGTLNEALDDITQADVVGINNEVRDVRTFGSYDEYMDIGGLADAIDAVNIGGIAQDATSQTVDGYAKALSQAVDNAVIAQTNSEGASGISMYYPGYEDQNYLDTFEVASSANLDDLYTVLSA